MRLILISTFCILTQMVLGQKTKAVNFDYVEKLDQTWDSIMYNGSLKTNKIDIPDCQLTEVEIKFDDTIRTIIQEETNRQIEKLKTIYLKEGISQNPIAKKTNQTCYRFGTATLAIFEHSVDFEFTKIITLLIIDNNRRLLYSRSNKLGLEMAIKCIQKKDNEYFIFGNSNGNPEFNCGGDFKLIFKNDNRIIKYSYCEENN